jgi:parvulin-like peptidyl-prolyl isomerase
MNFIVRTLFVLAASAVIAGCAQFDDANHNGSFVAPGGSGAAAAPRGPASQPSTAPAPTDPVAATVNGQPIYLADICDLLVREGGMPVAQQLIASEAVRQYAAKENVMVDDKDVREENERTIEDMFPTVDSASDRHNLLEQEFAKKAVSRQQWDILVHRNALLAKIAAKRVHVSEQEIHDAFDAQYGKKVIVRHIQCASVADAQKVLALVKKNPTDFPELAHKYSTNATAQNGGLISQPIGPKSPNIPPAFQNTALALKKVGEISDIVAAGTAFHILRLEELIDPQDVKFDDVKDKLAKAVRSRKLRAEQDHMLKDLVKTSKIVFVNPILKDQSQGQGGQANE